ncbi:MAG: alpha/beta hydrolase [Gammaproteobacteria bacterium]|nr:alpha/beta hydrolase [Gammaproteobacteria bacterium]
MKILKRLLIWMAGFVAVVVLAVAGLVTWFTVRGERQIAEQEIVDRHAEGPGLFLNVDGHEYHAVIRGDLFADPTDAPILMVHGFGPTGSNVILPLANELAATRSVIVPDMLGFGYSEKVSEPGAHFTVEGRASAILAMLDALGVEQFDLVGHSYGGSVSGRLALTAPDRVRRVVFVCPSIYPQTTPGNFIAYLPRSTARVAIWGSLGGGPSSFSGRACAADPAACDAHRIALVEGTVDALLAINKTPRGYALPGELPNVQPPALVIWGDDDAIVPPEFSARAAAAMGAETWIVPGGGHWPFAVEPAGVTERIRSFFAAGTASEALTPPDSMP